MGVTSNPTVHVTLSGGGTRAALLSGGALLAFHEMREDEKVEVASIDAVSGSSLLVANLVLASRDYELDDGGREGLLIELESVWRRGFGSPFRPTRLLGAGLAALAGAYFLGALATPAVSGDGPIFRNPGLFHWRLVSVPIFFLIAFLVMSRLDPVSFGRTGMGSVDGRGYWKQARRNQDYRPERDEVVQAGILPCPDIMMGGADVESFEMKWFSPYDTELATSSVDGVSPVQLALLSAAFPGMTPAVEVEGRYFLDGGGLDLLALDRVTKAAEEGSAVEDGAMVVIIDASVDQPMPTPARPVERGLDNLNAMIQVMLLPFVGVIAALWLGAVLDVSRLILLPLGTLALVLVGFRIINQAGWRLLFEFGFELAMELRVIPMFQTIQRHYRTDRAVAAGLELHTVRLRGAEKFPVCAVHGVDLGTKLSRMDPMVGLDLIEHGYREVNALFDCCNRDKTIAWLDRLRGEAAPSVSSRLLRSTKSALKAPLRLMVPKLGRPQCRPGCSRHVEP